MSDMGATARESSSQHNRFQYTTTRGISDSNRKVNTRRVLLLHRKQHLQLASRLGRGMVNFCLAGLLLCLALLLPWVNASQVLSREEGCRGRTLLFSLMLLVDKARLESGEIRQEACPE